MNELGRFSAAKSEDYKNYYFSGVPGMNVPGAGHTLWYIPTAQGNAKRLNTQKDLAPTCKNRPVTALEACLRSSHWMGHDLQTVQSAVVWGAQRQARRLEVDGDSEA